MEDFDVYFMGSINGNKLTLDTPRPTATSGIMCAGNVF
jgi:hypothetical protein